MLKKISLFVIGCLVLVIMAMGGLAQDKPEQKTPPPTMPKIHQVTLQSLVAKRDLVVEKANSLKLTYEKQLADLQAQYQDVAGKLDAEVKAAYADAGTTADQFDINVEAGTFVPKVQPKAPATPDAPKTEGK